MMFYSPNNNNQWVSSPLKIARGPLCAKINEDYRKFFMHDIHDSSTFPYSKDPSEDLCPLFEVVCIDLWFLDKKIYEFIHVCVLLNRTVASKLTITNTKEQVYRSSCMLEAIRCIWYLPKTIKSLVRWRFYFGCHNIICCQI